MLLIMQKGSGGGSRILHVGMGAFALQNCMVMKLFLLCFQRNIAKFLKIFRLFIYKSKFKCIYSFLYHVYNGIIRLINNNVIACRNRVKKLGHYFRFEIKAWLKLEAKIIPMSPIGIIVEIYFL